MTETSSTPKTLVGWILIVIQIILIAAFQNNPGDMDRGAVMTILSAISLLFAAWIMVFLYRLHKFVQEKTKGSYPISPGMAVGYSFIPFFNIYWLFKWILTMVDFIRSRSSEKAPFSKILPFLSIPLGLLVSILPIHDSSMRNSLAIVLGNAFWLLISGKLQSHLTRIDYSKEGKEFPDKSLKKELSPDEDSNLGKAWLIFPILLLVVFLVSCIILGFHGLLLRGRNWQYILLQGLSMTLISLGFNYTVLQKEFDISLGSQAAFIGILFASTLNSFLSSFHSTIGAFLGAMLISLICGTLLGAVQGSLVRFIRLPSFLVTIGGFLAFRKMARLFSKDSPISMIEIFPYISPTTMILFLLLIIGGILLFPVKKSPPGKTGILGKKFMPFLLGGIIAALFGILMVCRIGVAHSFINDGIELSLVLITLSSGILFRSGKTNILWIVGAAMVWTLAQNMMSLTNIDPFIHRIILSLLAGLILILSLIVSAVNDKKRNLLFFWISAGIILSFLIVSLVSYVSYGTVQWVKWIEPALVIALGFAGRMELSSPKPQKQSTS